MNRAQKVAWFNICAIGVGLVLVGLGVFAVLWFELPIGLNGGNVGTKIKLARIKFIFL